MFLKHPTHLAAFVILFLSVIGITSCHEKVVYEPDSTDPRLPAYTEKGNNVAGVLLNDIPWESYYTPGGFLKVPVNAINFVKDTLTDTLRIHFNGRVIYKIYDEYDVNIDFVLHNFLYKNLKYKKLDDFLYLNNQKIILDGIENYASIMGYGDFFNGTCGKGKGEIFIKSLKKVMIDNSKNYDYVISGTFSFEINSPCAKIKATQGRFDHKFYPNDVFFYN